MSAPWEQQAPPSLVPRHLELARAELARGVREDPPGSNTGPDVRRYLAPCVRGGRRLGLTSGAWCAAFASWCVWCAAFGGDAPAPALLAWAPALHRAAGWPPIGYRAAVSELVADAIATNTWRPVQAAEVPLPGDLVCMGRDGQDPRAGGHGHVEIVDEVTDAGLWCIGGNTGPQSDRVARTLRRMSEIVGWIRIG